MDPDTSSLHIYYNWLLIIFTIGAVPNNRYYPIHKWYITSYKRKRRSRIHRNI